MKSAPPTNAMSRAFEPAAPDVYKRAVRASVRVAERSLREPSVDDIHKLARRAP